MMELLVNGTRYAGWESGSVQRGLEQLAGGFSLAVSERINLTDDKPLLAQFQVITPGDSCQLVAYGQPVITGYVSKKTDSHGDGTHTVTVEGADPTADLTECSAILPGGQLKNQTATRIIQALCAPYSIGITTLAPTGPVVPNFQVEQGETVHAAIQRLIKNRNLLAVSDGQGGLVLTKAGQTRMGASLVLGQNLKTLDIDEDQSEVFSQYMVKGQSTTTATNNGKGTHSPSGRATTTGMRYRPLIVLDEGETTLLTASQRADWERKTRLAKSLRLTVTVAGWLTGIETGQLWQPNTLVGVQTHRPELDGDYLIASVDHQVQGLSTTLELVKPEAYA
jgi:prophage tail gpP-like protein